MQQGSWAAYCVNGSTRRANRVQHTHQNVPETGSMVVVGDRKDDCFALQDELFSLGDGLHSDLVRAEVVDYLDAGGDGVAGADRLGERDVLFEVDDVPGEAGEGGTHDASGEHSVGDPPTEHRLARVRVVEMDRIVVPNEVGVPVDGIGRHFDSGLGGVARRRDWHTPSPGPGAFTSGVNM